MRSNRASRRFIGQVKKKPDSGESGLKRGKCVVVTRS
jgi:hypothetical protein